MKIILLKRCYILYSFVLQCLTRFYLFFKSVIFLFLNFVIKEVLNESSINSCDTLRDFYFLTHYNY